jgi:antitoxin VapB
MAGNSQAVRIPAEYRLDTDRVEISRTASGDLVLHPVREGRGRALLRAVALWAESGRTTHQGIR